MRDKTTTADDPMMRYRDRVANLGLELSEARNQRERLESEIMRMKASVEGEVIIGVHDAQLDNLIK